MGFQRKQQVKQVNDQQDNGNTTENDKINSSELPGSGKPPPFFGVGNEAWKAAGINKDAVANAIKLDIV